MSLFRGIELISNTSSIALGGLPAGVRTRLPMTLLRRRGLSRAQIKKMAMRKRRKFVDTIIMNHKRMHDKNRALAIEKVKVRLVGAQTKSPKKASKKQNIGLNRSESKTQDSNKWRTKVRPKGDVRKKRTQIKGMVDDEKQKSRSRWAIRINEDGERNDD